MCPFRSFVDWPKSVEPLTGLKFPFVRKMTDSERATFLHGKYFRPSRKKIPAQHNSPFLFPL
ncbi:hypothetical protein BOX30_03655 [Leptospirillum ferriphilum]|nr:hypothetical protein BOX30_03655 [Leptospirillum ferriphilum]